MSNVNFSNMPIFFVEKKCEKLLQCKVRIENVQSGFSQPFSRITK